MRSISHHKGKNIFTETVLILVISLVTFITRVTNLLNIPIFTDEAIYIRWAQIGLADPAHRYIALTDGKQPLLTWLMYPLLLLFSDPLFAGRFVSVLSSVLTSIGIYFVSRELFGKRTAIMATLLYIISPFSLIYNRLALMDSLLSSFGVWSLYLSILLVRLLRLDVALLLGIVIGLGVLTKSSAFFYLFLLPLSLLLFDFKKKKKLTRVFKWIGLSVIALTIAQVMYNSLRLSPWFYIIEQKNYVFIYTLEEFLQKPFVVFLPNLGGLLDILFEYLTYPISMTLVVGVIWGLIEKKKEVIYLFLWFLLPFLALSAFGRVIFPRFILFMIMPLFIIIAYTIAKLRNFAYPKNKLLLLILPLLFVYPLYQLALVLTKPEQVDIPQVDRNQLFDDWPSGYGVKEVISFLEEKSKSGKIVLGTEGTFGLNPAVYEIYLGSNKNVDIHGFWPVSQVPDKLIDAASKYPTYLVFKEKQEVPENWPLKLIGKYRRGKGDSYLLFYQVKHD